MFQCEGICKSGKRCLRKLKKEGCCKLHSPQELGECCVCLCEMNIHSDFVKTKCGHYYHKKCLNEWCKTHNTCPLCRTQLHENLPIPHFIFEITITSYQRSSTILVQGTSSEAILQAIPLAILNDDLYQQIVATNRSFIVKGKWQGSNNPEIILMQM